MRIWAMLVIPRAVKNGLSFQLSFFEVSTKGIDQGHQEEESRHQATHDELVELGPEQGVDAR